MNKKLILFSIILLALYVPAHAQKYVISTVAGDGIESDSGDGGPAIKAGLAEPYGIAVDDSGNLYIGDQNNSKVRKVDTKGIITTVAGNDTAYHLDDGNLATQAGISVPLGVTKTPTGILYIADWNHRRIRKVDKNGIISTYAGNGINGYSSDGGLADTTRISGPYGIITDKYGNLYISDAFNFRVRKVDTNGIITTFAGTGVQGHTGDGGQATDAQINEPLGVAADTAGNVFICSFQYVRKVDKNGIISTYAGNGTSGHSGDGGPATNAQIGGPFDCALGDSGNLYIVETYYNYIRKIKPNDTITTIAGNGVQAYSNYYGNPDTASMWFPMEAAVDHFGNVFFADENNQLIRELSPCSPVVAMAPLMPEICRGQSVTLTANGRNTYSWSPGKSLADSTGLSVIASPAVTTTYTLSGTTCFARATIVVTVDTIPVVTITPPSPASFCPGGSILLTASGADAYKWSPPTGLSDTIGSAVTADPTTSTTYTIIGSVTNSCPSSQPVTEVVNLSQAPNKPSITVKGDTLISSADAGNQWYVNDTIIKGATDSLLIIGTQVTGIYKVIVENVANGCSSTSDSVVISGINQLSINNNQLSVYPNPTSNRLTVESGQLIVKDVTLTNVLGQIVYKKTIAGSHPNTSLNLTIDVSALPDGLYFITVTSDNETAVKKVVVSR